MNDERIRERILAVYNLMQRAGTQGEMEAAQARLDEMLNKYNVTLESLFSATPKTAVYNFTYADKWEKKILLQTVFKVTNHKGSLSYWQRSNHKIGFKLTEEQYIDIDLLYTAYRAAWKEELELLMSAFLNKNRIFSEKNDEQDGIAPDLTQERIDYLIRLKRAMSKMDAIADPRSAAYLSDGT